MPISVMRAINRALPGVRTDMVSIARREYNVKARAARRNIRVYKASKDTMSGAVVSTGRPIPLINFDVRPSRPQPKRRKPITVEVIRGQREEVGGGAFVAVMPSGHKGVFWRAKKGGKKVGRLPIHELSGPRIEDLYARRNVMVEIERKADERMAKELGHQADYLFRQRMGML
jgi:hypothetical protein